MKQLKQADLGRSGCARMPGAAVLLGMALLVWPGGNLRAATDAAPPAPYGVLPSERQLKWHELEMYAFIHFSMNTFTDKEWGYGDEPESLFNPTAFNAEQIVGTLKETGMKGIMLTCKHHDGFCLWPSQYTEHSVKNSPWKNGKGDVVREISEACRKHGLKFGVYLSPWDRNHKDYARPEYITYFRNQLRELLTNYGPIYEVWFDGANGGDGFYGGARERRRIDNLTYYDWENTWQIVRELHPDACMFSDGGPDIRWVGNEQGFAGETCWHTINREGMLPGVANGRPLTQGQRPGTHWLPAEVDVSIRPGWFYHTNEDNAVKSVGHLLKIYFESVGRGANLILNIPPDRRGQIHENDVKALREWHRLLENAFAENLAKGAIITASNTRGLNTKFAGVRVLDGKRDTYWATDDNALTGELVFNLGRPVTFNVVRLREYLPLGQRIEGVALDAWQNGKWEEFATATSIGNQRLITTRYVTADKVRLRVTQAAACPAISEFGLYNLAAPLTEPKVARDKNGLVTIGSETVGPWIRYTLDGAEVTEQSPLYEKPFPLPLGGTIKARAFLPQAKQASGLTTAVYGIAKGKWKIAGKSFAGRGGDAGKAIDENPRTFWHTSATETNHAAPQNIVVDLGESVNIKGFTVLPRQDGNPSGVPDRYEFHVSADGKTWGDAVAVGEFANIQANPIQQTVTLSKTVAGRYVRFTATHVVAGTEVTLAELGVLAP